MTDELTRAPKLQTLMPNFRSGQHHAPLQLIQVEDDLNRFIENTCDVWHEQTEELKQESHHDDAVERCFKKGSPFSSPEAFAIG